MADERRTRYTLDEWQTEVARLCGGEITKESCQRVTFECPACHETHSVGDFVKVMEDRGELSGFDPGTAAQQCFHRFVGDGKCDWCAFGLFRGPVIITHPDGTESGVFHFGEPLPEGGTDG